MAIDENAIVLSGHPGRMDKLLEAEASRLISGGHLSGAWESQALLSSRGRVASEFILFAGIGNMRKLSSREISDRIEKVTQKAIKISARSIAAYVPMEGFSGDFETLAAETVAGALRGVANCPYDVNLIFCESEPGRYGELVAVSERIVFRRRKEKEISLEVVL